MIVSRHRSVLVNAVLGEPAPEIEDVHAGRFGQLPEADETFRERCQRVTLPDGQIVHRLPPATFPAPGTSCPTGHVIRSGTS